MVYKFIFHKKAIADLDNLDPTDARRIIKKIKWLQSLVNPITRSKQLIDSTIGDIRFRVGDYRIIAVINKQEMVIVSIGHRKEIYKRGY